MQPQPLRQPDEPRPPPLLYSNEAEQALLGAVLCDNILVGRVSGLLAPEDFGNAVHGRIWTSVTRAVGDGADANPVTLKGVFDHDEALKQIGGAAYLGRLAKEGALVSHPEDYARIVRELALRREILAVAQDLTDAAHGDFVNVRVADILARHQARVDEIKRGTPEATARRFKLVDAADLRPNKASPFLIRGIVPAQGLIVVWGPPKCGKSFWVLDVGFHIALDREYRGRRVKQGLIVYIGCEGEFAIPARLEAFRQEKIKGPIDPGKFRLILTRLGLASEADALITDLKAQLGDQLPAVIVIDTLNRSIEGSESSDEDMGNYVKAADKLREVFHCAVIIIHHCGINGERPRGHTSLTGAADAQIRIEKDKTGLITATVEYMKDGPDGEQTTSRLRVIEVGLDDDGEVIASCVIEPAEDDGETQRATKPPQLSAANKIAFQQLRKAIDEAGQTPPACNHMPPGRSAVSEDTWRRYCYAGQVSGSDNPEAKRKASNGRPRPSWPPGSPSNGATGFGSHKRWRWPLRLLQCHAGGTFHKV
jgi:hypothetical protein